MHDIRRRSPGSVGALTLLGVLTLSACGGTAAPASTAAASVQAPSASGDAKWNDLLAAGRKEGKVAVMGPTISTLSDAYTKQFPKDSGIQLEYVAVPTGETGVRAPREVASGSPSFDVVQSGAFPMDGLEPNGQLQPVRPLLILPEVTDPAAWRGDKGVKYIDKNATDVPEPTSSSSPPLFINTTLVPPGSIKSGRDLLDPKWKGKIVAADPRMVGPGQQQATYYDEVFGPEFITSLYKGQAVVLVKSDVQAAEGVARGTYAFGIGISTQAAEQFIKEKLPIAPEMPADAAGYVTGGFSPIAFVKGAPHPKAAAVFLNWALSKSGQTTYSQAMLEVSERKDVSTEGIPSYRVPKDGVNYLDVYSYDYYLNKRRPHTQEVIKLLEG